MVCIIDRSGSMRGLEADTIGGFNAMLDQQRTGDGEVYISTILFDDRVEVLHDRENMAKVPYMTEKQYYVRGCTALLDAIGGAVRHIGLVHKYAREEDRPAKTLFMITTDGMENASKHYDYETVRRMVEHQQEKYGWEFLFIGAGMDAIQEAGRFGIRAERAATYSNDSEGLALNYRVMSETVTMARAAVSPKDFEQRMEKADRLEPIRSREMKRKRS